jgi:deoxyribose-phosphate aldolase
MTELSRLIDHTLLRPDATGRQIDQLCREAMEYEFATVCVNPVWVVTATAALRGSVVGVSTVVAFPFGATRTEVKAYEMKRAIDEGAREIDVVINIGALKSGDLGTVEHDIAAVTIECHRRGAVLKTILETAYLTDEEKVTACRLATRAGADYVKTSTGFGPAGATVADVALMRRSVGDAVGIKAAGGIRDLSGVRAMLAAGATRIGTSAGVHIVRQCAASERNS